MKKPKKYYNLEKLIRVDLKDYEENDSIEYKNEFVLFGRILQKAGYYSIFLHTSFIGVDCPENNSLIDGIVYVNPCVVLNYCDNFRKHYYFDTIEKAQEFADEIISQGNFIK